jgi:hypothetical protein
LISLFIFYYFPLSTSCDHPWIRQLIYSQLCRSDKQLPHSRACTIFYSWTLHKSNIIERQISEFLSPIPTLECRLNCSSLSHKGIHPRIINQPNRLLITAAPNSWTCGIVVFETIHVNRELQSWHDLKRAISYPHNNYPSPPSLSNKSKIFGIESNFGCFHTRSMTCFWGPQHFWVILPQTIVVF